MEQTDAMREQQAKSETPRVSPEDVAKVINNGVAELRLKKGGIEQPTAEQIKAEADKIPASLTGYDLEQVKARQQFNLDVAEWIGSVTGAGK